MLIKIRRPFLLAVLAILIATPLQAKHYKVFLMGGQSNMFGFGTSTTSLPPELQGPQEDLLFYYGTNFTFLQPGSGGAWGSEISFGRTIADAFPDENFYFIKHSDGGTSLWNEWNLTNGRSYNLLKEVVGFGLDGLTRAGHTYEIVGMVWAQGERDAWNLRTTQQYQDDFNAFIADIRSRYGADLPFLFARLSVKQTARPYEAVRLAQELVAASDPNVHMIDADDYGILTDNLHYTAQGYIDMGRDFAQAYLNSLSGDSSAPMITTLAPTNSAPAVEPTANLRLTFNEAVKLGTGQITLRQSGGALVESFDVASASARLTLSGDTVTIDPGSLLSPSTGYYIEIDPTAIDDLAGNSFAGISGDSTWSFTTAATDSTPPGIVSLSPAHAATGVKFDTRLILGFSENVSFGTGSITLKKSDGTVVETHNVASPPANLRLSGSSLTIKPGADLLPATGYYIEIDATAIDDPAGNSFAGISGDGTWSFTTAGAVIDGTKITASASNISMGDVAFTFGSGTQAWHPYRTIDGSGLSAGEHGSADRTGWLTKKESIQGVPPAVADSYIQWDLGDSYRLDSIHIWNMNKGGDTSASVRSVDVYYSNVEFPGDPEGEGAANWTRLGGAALEFPQAPASSNTGFDLATATGTTLPTTGVRYVRFELNSSWRGDDNFTGISEIQFTAASGGADSTPPAISILQPENTGTGVSPASNLSLTFTEEIVLGTGNIRLLQTGGAVVETFDVASSASGVTVSGATLTLNPSNLLAGSTTYYIEIDATAIDDLPGNSFSGISGSGTWSFTTAAADATAPGIASQSPRPGAVEVNPAANLILVFDEDVRFGTGAVTLRQSDGTLVQSFDVGTPGDGLTLSGKTLTINPSASLADSTTYYLEIDATAIDDLTGNSFAGISGPGAWSFTTIVPDVTAPDIASTNPANGADFFPADNLFVTFNEWIALGTGFIHLRKSDGSLVESFDVTNPSSGVSYLADTVTINPTNDLPLGTNFYIEIESTAILDNSGNHYPGTVGSTTWNFSVPASVAYTTITHVGTQFDIESGANDPTVGWRNTSPAKPLDIDGDNILGTDGYLTSDRVSNPVYAVTAKLAPNGNGGGKVYDDPNNPSGDDIGLQALHDASAGTGQETRPLIEFTITEDLPPGTTLRVGILLDLITVSNGSNTATYTLKQTFGGTASATTPALAWDGVSMDVAYFDLTDVRATHKYVITSTTIATPNHPGPFEQVIGVTFDTGTSGPDETAPTVSAFNPAHTATDISPTANLTVTFDETIAFGTGTITLRQSGGALVESFDVATPPAGLTLSGSTVTLDPTSDLANSTTYYLEIDATAIDDLAGNSFAGFSGDGTWSFTTAAADENAPSPATLGPVNGAVNVGLSANLAITFDEEVVFGTGTITLRQSGGALVESFDVANPPAGLTLDGDSITIDPASDLSSGTTYYIEIDATAIDDLAGNSFVGFTGDGTWSFTTAAQLVAARFDYGGSSTLVQAGFTQVSDPSGTATSNGITISSFPAFEFRDRTGQINGEGFGSDPQVNLLSDLAFENDSSSITFTLTGLTPLAEYAVVGYAYDADFSNDSVVNNWTTNGGTVSHGWEHEDISTARFELANLTADANGEATIIGSYNLASIIIWNGFEISAIAGTDPTFSDWIGGFNNLGSLTAFSDDADGDGDTNGEEAYFGTHPGDASRSLSAGEVNLNGGTTFTFTHPVNANPVSGITATYIWSTDLATFYANGLENGGTTVTFSAGDPDENNIVTVTATVSGTTVDRLFVDVNVAPNP